MIATVLLRPGTGRELRVDFDVPNALFRGAGLHRLTAPMKVDSCNTIPAGVPVRLSGELWLGNNRGDWLGWWQTDRPVVTRNVAEDYNLVLPLTDQQLAIIEQRRAGADLQLWLDVHAEVGYEPTVAGGSLDQRWPHHSAQLSVNVHKETWVRLLSQLGVGTSFAVVVPTPLTPGAEANIGEHLREAIRKISNGEYKDAATEARSVIDVINDLHGIPPSEQAIINIKKVDRSLEERLALLRHAIHGLASPAAHGDPAAAAIRWDHAKATAVVAATAALAACLPALPPPTAS